MKRIVQITTAVGLAAMFGGLVVSTPASAKQNHDHNWYQNHRNAVVHRYHRHTYHYYGTATTPWDNVWYQHRSDRDWLRRHNYDRDDWRQDHDWRH